MEPVELAPTLRPLLDAGEKIVCVQNRVGLYQGTVRDEEHDNGTVYLTSSRIVYVDQMRPRGRSVALHLSLVRKQSLHTGFLYSSSKISLYLGPEHGGDEHAPSVPAAASAIARVPDRPALSRGGAPDWKCTICDHVNKDGPKCVLCGVPRPADAPEIDIGSVEQPVRCLVCTFDNHSSMSRCEMCDSELQLAADEDGAGSVGAQARQDGQGPGGRGPDTDGNAAELVRLSFRAGGASTFYSALKEARSAWAAETASAARKDTLATVAGAAERERRPTTGGISTIVSAAHESERARDVTLKSAFSDLDALTAMANEMVGMAEHIATQLNSPAASKLRRQGSGESDEDSAARVDAFRQYLLDLGIDSPVTKDSAGAVFHAELARELCDYLENYVSQRGGTVALVDAYCLYNRAREFSLVYPSDFVQACGKFGELGLSLRLREYPSGLLVLEDPSSASDEQIIGRVSAYIRSFGPVTANDMAAMDDCPLTLAEERLWLCERAGRVCRDESVEGVRFYINRFNGAPRPIAAV
ncbi:Vacuolar protein-sorting-associated protein 36 [Coemansia sp. RSA 552]|nr:Vacuolar protein-sorting-associated protein 36 [Coemansia sp. RSA 552]